MEPVNPYELIKEFSSKQLISDIGVLETGYDVTRTAHARREPLLFTLHGYEQRIYTNIYGSRRLLYMVLGASSDIEAYKRLLQALRKPGRLREEGFTEHYRAVEKKLSEMPFIKYYREDGGKYLTSSVIAACIDDVCNASFHRMMLVGDNEAAVRIVPRHLYRIHASYREKGRDTPVAVILGAHPYVELAAAMSPPYGVYELGLAAAMAGGSMPIVYTPRYNIPVPAYASMIIEGRITGKLVDEGPFVDILMIPDRVRKQPVFVADAVYYNRDMPPLYHAIVPGLMEHVLLMGFPREALVYEECSRIADVRAVRLTPGSGGWLAILVAVHEPGPGIPYNLGMAAFTAHPSAKIAVVVDDDIDLDDPAMVEWAIATRFQAGRGLAVLPRSRGSTLDPSGDDGVVDKVIVDATIPRDKPRELFRRVKPP